MYGYMYVGEILPAVAKTGATHIDLWPERHGNQREQLTRSWRRKVRRDAQQAQRAAWLYHAVCSGTVRSEGRISLAQRFGCQLIVTGGEGPKGLSGAELKSAVGVFIERMKPHLALAEECGVTVAIENHGNNLFETADRLRYLRDLTTSKKSEKSASPLIISIRMLKNWRR